MLGRPLHTYRDFAVQIAAAAQPAWAPGSAYSSGQVLTVSVILGLVPRILAALSRARRPPSTTSRPRGQGPEIWRGTGVL